MKARVAVLLVFFCLAGCAGAPAPSASERAHAAAADHSARVAAIIASWEAAGGSRSARPRSGTSMASSAAVSAAWWGFDPVDSTACLQAAIDSGAPIVIVPRMDAPWTISDTLDLRSGGVEILLESGVVLLAARGAFLRPDEPLILADRAADFSIVGYGAALRMRRSDYERDPYPPGQWRHAISLRGVRRALVAGLSIEEAGGDGIYVGTYAVGTSREPSQDVTLRDLDISNSYRQGISLTSAFRLLVDECQIRGSSGTPPMAGIDFEPNSHDPGFRDCLFRDCRIQGNAGVGVLLVLTRLTGDSAPVSIQMERCSVDNLPIAIWLRGLQGGVRGTLILEDSSFRGLSFLRGSSGFSVVSRASR